MKYAATLLGSAALAAAHGFSRYRRHRRRNLHLLPALPGPLQQPRSPTAYRAASRATAPSRTSTRSTSSAVVISAGGIEGSEPAALHAKVAAGEEVTLFWTLRPSRMSGPTLI